MALRVTLIGHYPPPYGGVATLMAQMEAALSSAGCRVTIFNLGHGRPEGERVINLGDRNRIRETLRLWRTFANSDSDIFHYISASYRSFWLAVVCITLATLTRKRMVVSFVGGAFTEFIETLGSAKRCVARLALSRATALLACNDEIARVLGRLVPEAETTKISNSFPFDAPSADALPSDVREFLASRSPVITTTGAASTEYGLIDAVRAVGRLRERHSAVGLVIVMTRYGNAEYEVRLLDSIEDERLSEHVLLARDLPSFVSLLGCSDVFLRCTLVDGDSMSVREALALGVPVVASDTPFRPDGAILYRRGDVDGMIERLIEALNTGRADSGAARGEAEANLRVLVDVYEGVASGASSSRQAPKAGSNAG